MDIPLKCQHTELHEAFEDKDYIYHYKTLSSPTIYFRRKLLYAIKINIITASLIEAIIINFEVLINIASVSPRYVRTDIIKSRARSTREDWLSTAIN